MPIAGIADAIDVGVGIDSACAVTAGRRVYCWGNDDTDTPYAPELVRGLGAGAPPLDNVVTLRVGLKHACALLADESLACWGDNDSGQLGTGSTAKVTRNRYVTVDLDDEPIAAFACGGVHTCAVTTAGDLYCWGDNSNAALGTETPSYKPSAWPLKHPTLTNVVSIFGGAGAAHACGGTRDGRFFCWGRNYHCQLGSGNCPAGAPQVVPTDVTEWP